MGMKRDPIIPTFVKVPFTFEIGWSNLGCWIVWSKDLKLVLDKRELHIVASYTSYTYLYIINSTKVHKVKRWNKKRSFIIWITYGRILISKIINNYSYYFLSIAQLILGIVKTLSSKSHNFIRMNTNKQNIYKRCSKVTFKVLANWKI